MSAGRRGGTGGGRTSDRPSAAGADSPIVLVVDDELPIAQLLAGLVADLGYTPVLASHGRQALALALKVRPALVLTDFMMPYVDGAGLATALRQAAAADGRAAPPIILISSAGTPAVETVGADAVLPKPFEIDDVIQLLVHYLGPGRAQPVGEEGAR